MKYICKEGFAVELCDDDGWSTDEYMEIEQGEVYEVNDDWHRVAGGYDTIRLENNDNGNWLELLPETIDRYFVSADKEAGKSDEPLEKLEQLEEGV